MLELTTQNAAAILHSRGHLADANARVQELSGGVSNAVFLVEHGADRFVVKQARSRLRVAADWQCSVERIWREVAVLERYNEILRLSPSGETPNCLPQILWTDGELYAYAMTAALPGSRTWKELLLAGAAPAHMASAAGDLLGFFHGHTWHEPSIAADFRDRTFFAQLRLEPYYLAAADRYPALATPLGDLVDQTWREQHALVHGDFSPKNILVLGGAMLLIDFEVGHYGDPAFDVGFCLTHLVLKAIHLPEQRVFLLESIHKFWRYYFTTLKFAFLETELSQIPEVLQALEQRCIQHLAGCLVARVFGKSPVDYLSPAEQLRAVELAELLFGLCEQAAWKDALELIGTATVLPGHSSD